MAPRSWTLNGGPKRFRREPHHMGDARQWEHNMTQGWASIPRWLLYSQDVTPKAKLVYLVIQSHTNEQGTAWPSQATIATESGLSLATVKRGLEELRERGLVTSDQRRRKDGGKTSSIYAVALVVPPVDKAVDNQPHSSL